MELLEVSHLRKTFGSIVAVDDISFTVQKGEVFTIIGPNGAGKTTTLEMVEGLQKPDQGEIRINGMNWAQHGSQMKQVIGVQPQSSALFDLLSVYENLDVFASFYNKSRSITEIMELINLTEHRNKKVSSLSGGQKQRLAVGLALVNDPELLFLDEPTTGLDPQARRNLWDIILKLKEMGKTTILTTHYMEEADKLSDRVCIVDQGKVVAIDTPKKLIEQLSQEREVELTLSAGNSAAMTLKAGLFGLIAMVEMRRNGLLKRLMLSPVNMKLFGLSSMMVRFILSAIQAVLLTLIGVLFYHASIDIDIIAFLLTFLIGTTAFSAIGFMVSSLTKTPDSYFGLANLFSFVMMFLSGIFFDSSSLPAYIKPISDVLPLTYFANGIRDSMVYGLNMMHSAFWLNLGVLAAWGIVAFIIGSRFYKWKG